jgi:hypothetical protein
MAKLRARGRREWLRAIRKNPDGTQESRAYMSDGTILVNKAYPGSPWGRWKVFGKFDRVRPLPSLRDELIAEGFIIQPVGKLT